MYILFLELKLIVAISNEDITFTTCLVNNVHLAMKNFYFISRITFYILFFLSTSNSLFAQTQTANYTVTFQGTWSNTTHPIANFPSSAHWSDLVGATHNNSIVFVAPGTLATLGIENVAEGGIDDDFNLEVQNAIMAGNADVAIDQPFASFSPTSSASVAITVDKDFPLLSLASMIAPSPDWIIQVNSLSIIDINGDWIPSIVMDLYPYDAGTEEGTTYSFANPETVPQQPITSLQNIAPFSNAKVGTLTVSLVSLGIDDIDTQSTIHISTDAASKSIQIHNTNRENIQQIEVYNSLGTMVKQYATPTKKAMYNFSFPTLKDGLYFIKLQSERGIVVKKLLL
ncbi:spondin domain-containing protein [Kordia sp. YSTF-M3]|uniref:Spondin domain-containing protein n=1 Tax=Kordia aestuariivivens TaxID=2759037 RepID=A0ABR7QFI8_9FLAO|nr:spondin domain-containing protein [Kordia aestuariivivens]MBC8757340.1 spondin domain-containing protein [Kordia aestuariivivens]